VSLYNYIEIRCHYTKIWVSLYDIKIGVSLYNYIKIGVSVYN